MESIFQPRTKVPVPRRRARARVDLSRDGIDVVRVIVSGRGSGGTKSSGAETVGVVLDDDGVFCLKMLSKNDV